MITPQGAHLKTGARLFVILNLQALGGVKRKEKSPGLLCIGHRVIFLYLLHLHNFIVGGLQRVGALCNFAGWHPLQELNL